MSKGMGQRPMKSGFLLLSPKGRQAFYLLNKEFPILQERESPPFGNR